MTYPQKTCFILVSCLLLIPGLIIQDSIFGAPDTPRGPDVVGKTVVGAAGAPASAVGIKTNGTMA